MGKEQPLMNTRLAIAALVTMGLACASVAAQAKKHKHIRHQISTMQPGTYGTTGISTTPSGMYGTTGMSTTPSGTYGTSGTSIGTVTAPSVGSYNWPSVGVTNAVPTWNNTNPPVRR